MGTNCLLVTRGKVRIYKEKRVKEKGKTKIITITIEKIEIKKRKKREEQIGKQKMNKERKMKL